MTVDIALSLKQPWAALLVAGRKTIEIRRWSTRRRGRILIHAAMTADDRPQAWAAVAPEWQTLANLRGGIIGAAELYGNKVYRTAEAFALEQPQHCNDPSWFTPPRMFGFLFRAPQVLPFRRYRGKLHFFEVPPEEPAPSPLFDKTV